jgi:hypothetical protein
MTKSKKMKDEVQEVHDDIIQVRNQKKFDLLIDFKF